MLFSVDYVLEDKNTMSLSGNERTFIYHAFLDHIFYISKLFICSIKF